MSRTLCCLLLLALAPAAALGQADGKAHTYGDVVIQARWSPRPGVSRFGGNSFTHGYLEYRFSIENTSRENAHTVTLTLPDRSTSCVAAGSRCVW